MGAAKKAARARSRPKLSRAENAVFKRRRILEAALEEFALKGFGTTRMEDVARRAGVGKGTLYLYFDDKEALFEGLVREFILPPLTALREVQRRPGESVGDAMRRVMPTVVARAARSRVGDLLRLLIGEGARFPRLADFYRRSVIEPMIVRMRKLLREAKKQGELASDGLIEFPHLLMAPALVGLIFSGLFARALPLDVAAMIGVHLDLVFPKKRSRRVGT